MTFGSTATIPLPTGSPIAVRPGNEYATASTRSLYDGASALDAGATPTAATPHRTAATHDLHLRAPLTTNAGR
jgi:hypothetical protein